MVAEIELQLRRLTVADRTAWDAVADCFMQSWAWANFKEKEGYQTFRLGLFTADRCVGGVILYFYGQGSMLAATGGPIWMEGYDVEGMRLLRSAATQIAQEVGAIGLRIEPTRTLLPESWGDWGRSPTDLLPSETLLIDLNLSTSELLTAMHPKGRYNIKVAARHGVTIRFSDALDDLNAFYDCFWNTVKRQGFLGEPYGFFINLCQTLFGSGMAEIGFAEINGEVLATVLIIYWNGRATYLYGGHNRDRGYLMANYGLQWEAIKRAKSYGCHTYDFYGFTQEANHAYSQFSEFKRKFGGQVVKTIGAHDIYFYDQLADRMAKILDAIG
jgi:peptidoglycan pentaglycine glycine transferase (the first glycine)